MSNRDRSTSRVRRHEIELADRGLIILLAVFTLTTIFAFIFPVVRETLVLSVLAPTLIAALLFVMWPVFA